MLDAGAEFGIKPCGLGARNTLRLEAKMALYGHEIDASISPLEADLGWIVKLDKGEFVGRDALLKQQDAAASSASWSGSRCAAAASAATATKSCVDGAPAGWVTSGGPSPDAEQEHRPVLSAGGAGRARARRSKIMIRNQPVDAVTVETPFYKRAK